MVKEALRNSFSKNSINKPQDVNEKVYLVGNVFVDEPEKPTGLAKDMQKIISGQDPFFPIKSNIAEADYFGIIDGEETGRIRIADGKRNEKTILLYKTLPKGPTRIWGVGTYPEEDSIF